MENDNMIFRGAVPSDAAELKRITDIWGGEKAVTAASIAASLIGNGREIVCVAESGGVLAGYSCAQVATSMCCRDDYAEITNLFISEEWRGRGMGRKLLAFTEGELNRRGITHIHLSTDKSNITALHIYRTSGYDDEYVALEKDCVI